MAEHDDLIERVMGALTSWAAYGPDISEEGRRATAADIVRVAQAPLVEERERLRVELSSNEYRASENDSKWANMYSAVVASRDQARSDLEAAREENEELREDCVAALKERDDTAHKRVVEGNEEAKLRDQLRAELEAVQRENAELRKGDGSTPLAPSNEHKPVPGIHEFLADLDLELHYDTGDPRDMGFMACWSLVKMWANANAAVGEHKPVGGDPARIRELEAQLAEVERERAEARAGVKQVVEGYLAFAHAALQASVEHARQEALRHEADLEIANRPADDSKIVSKEHGVEGMAQSLWDAVAECQGLPGGRLPDSHRELYETLARKALDTLDGERPSPAATASDVRSAVVEAVDECASEWRGKGKKHLGDEPEAIVGSVLALVYPDAASDEEIKRWHPAPGHELSKRGRVAEAPAEAQSEPGRINCPCGASYRDGSKCPNCHPSIGDASERCGRDCHTRRAIPCPRCKETGHYLKDGPSEHEYDSHAICPDCFIMPAPAPSVPETQASAGAYDPEDLRVELVGLARDRAEIDSQIKRVRSTLESGCEHNGTIYRARTRDMTVGYLWRCGDCFTEHHGYAEVMKGTELVDLPWQEFIDRRPPGGLSTYGRREAEAEGRSQPKVDPKETGDA